MVNKKNIKIILIFFLLCLLFIFLIYNLFFKIYSNEKSEENIVGRVIESSTIPTSNYLKELGFSLSATKTKNLTIQSKGYLIQFKKEPLAVKERELKQSNKKPEEIKELLKTYKEEMVKEHKSATTNISYIKGEHFSAFNGIFIEEISSDDLKKLKNLPYVKKISPNYEVKFYMMDSVPLINADDIWIMQDKKGLNITGQGVKIAIIDTGVDYTHPDLGGCFGKDCKVIEGYDFVNNDSDPMDDNGHGTHCAGIAAGSGDGGLKGIAPDAKIYAYKVLNSEGMGYMEDIIAAVERAIDPNKDGDFSDKADVVSMSLGANCWMLDYSEDCGPDDPLSISIDNAVSLGTVAVIAAGNSGPGFITIGSPGTARKAITVGATDKNDKIAIFSSIGPVIWNYKNSNRTEAKGILMKPDVVAPGVNICSSQYASAWDEYKCFDNKHVAISGTSMATPMIAGVVSLIKQANPKLTPQEIKQILKQNSLKITGDIIREGGGRIDALKPISNTKNINAILNTGGLYNKSISHITIKGTASGKDFSRYVLEYKNYFDDSEWIFLNESSKPIENSILGSLRLKGFGVYKLRLKVFDKTGNYVSDDNLIIRFNNTMFCDSYENCNFLLSASRFFSDYPLKLKLLKNLEIHFSEVLIIYRMNNFVLDCNNKYLRPKVFPSSDIITAPAFMAVAIVTSNNISVINCNIVGEGMVFDMEPTNPVSTALFIADSSKILISNNSFYNLSGGIDSCPFCKGRDLKISNNNFVNVGAIYGPINIQNFKKVELTKNKFVNTTSVQIVYSEDIIFWENSFLKAASKDYQARIAILYSDKIYLNKSKHGNFWGRSKEPYFCTTKSNYSGCAYNDVNAGVEGDFIDYCPYNQSYGSGTWPVSPVCKDYARTGN